MRSMITLDMPADIAPNLALGKHVRVGGVVRVMSLGRLVI